jgi:hypothetical protein
MARYETALFNYINNIKRQIDLRPLKLGGTVTGSGGPPGGFQGFLPQRRVSYDVLEQALSGFVDGGYNPSGILISASLLDNLNHIRYRIGQLEAGSGIAGSIIVQEDDIVVASGVTVLNFEGSVSTLDEGAGKVTVTVTGSGGPATDEKAKVSANDTTAGYLEDKIVAGNNITITTLNDGSNETLEITSTASGVGGVGQYWDVMLPPASGTAYDDEFNDESFDTGLWTEVDHGTLQTVNEDEFGLRLEITHNAGDDWAGVYQTLPAGAFTLVTKIEPEITNVAHYNQGLMLLEDATDSAGDWLGIFGSYSTTAAITVARYSSYTTHQTTYTQYAGHFHHEWFLRIRFDGTNTYSFDYSHDGKSWTRIYTTASLAITPAEFCLAGSHQQGSTRHFRFPFFRYLSTEANLYDPIYGDVESGGGGGGISGITIQEDDATIATTVTTLNFEGTSSAVDEGSGKVTVTTSGGVGAGVDDFLDLTDTPSEYGSYNANKSVKVSASGTQLVFTDPYFYPGKKPTSDTPDDDFEASSLTGWSTIGVSTGAISILANSSNSRYSLTERPGHLVVLTGTNRSFQFRKSYTVPDAKSLILAVSPAINSDSGIVSGEVYCGLALANTDVAWNDDEYLAIYFNAISNQVQVISEYEGPIIIGSTGGTSSTGHGTLSSAGQMYFRIARATLTYHCFVSRDGVTWTGLNTHTETSAFTNVYIFGGTTSSMTGNDVVHSFDWIRLGTNNLDPW